MDRQELDQSGPLQGSGDDGVGDDDAQVVVPDGVDDDSAIVGTAPQAQDVVVVRFLRRHVSVW